MASTPDLRIATRAQLGATRYTSTPPYVTPESRTGFWIHYYGLGTPPRQLRAFRAAVERIHMIQNSWRSVGYTWLVDADGNAGEGTDQNAVGSHSPLHNRDAWSCIVWTENGVPTDAAMATARRLYERACRLAGHRLRMGYHRLDYPTDCPGDALTAWVRAGMPYPKGYDPTPADRPQPQPTRPEELDMTINELMAHVIGHDRKGQPITVGQALARGAASYEAQMSGGWISKILATLQARTAAVQSRRGLIDIRRALGRGVSAYEQLEDQK